MPPHKLVHLHQTDLTSQKTKTTYQLCSGHTPPDPLRWSIPASSPPPGHCEESCSSAMTSSTLATYSFSLSQTRYQSEIQSLGHVQCFLQHFYMMAKMWPKVLIYNFLGKCLH